MIDGSMQFSNWSYAKLPFATSRAQLLVSHSPAQLPQHLPKNLPSPKNLNRNPTSSAEIARAGVEFISPMCKMHIGLIINSCCCCLQTAFGLSTFALSFPHKAHLIHRLFAFHLKNRYFIHHHSSMYLSI